MSAHAFITTAICALVFTVACTEARLQFRGPLVTVTLRDPYDKVTDPSPVQTNTVFKSEDDSDAEGDAEDEGSSTIFNQKGRRPWRRLKNVDQTAPVQFLSNLSPSILYAIQSANPLPKYFPALKSLSLTSSYNYHDIKNKPNIIEGDMRLYSKRLGLDFDIGTSHNVKREATALTLRVGAMEDPLRDGTTRGGGNFGIGRFIFSRGKNYLQSVKAQYNLNLPFQGIGVDSLSIIPSYNFETSLHACTMVGYSGSGRTAAILNLNWDNPTLSVKRALDARNTIQPEISLWDAKILYNWNVALDSGSIMTRVDPTEAVQITWVDETRSGKWVTDFRLPLVSGGGTLASHIRVRRQFAF
jgi:hypothetical protein